MPTLEDTIEFQASTLNDLLEADAKAVALPSQSEGKYRSWAFVSTAAAGLLAILLVVALVTDSGGGKGTAASTASKKKYEGSAVTVRVSQINSDVLPDTFVDVRDKTGAVVLSNVPVTKIIPEGKGNFAGPSVEVTLPPGVSTDAYDKAFPTGREVGKVVKNTGGATPPATTAPESTPTTAAPASTPETTPATTPPATG